MWRTGRWRYVGSVRQPSRWRAHSRAAVAVASSRFASGLRAAGLVLSRETELVELGEDMTPLARSRHGRTGHSRCSPARFLAAVLSENVQRANFNPIEEANGLRAMLDLHGGNRSATAKAMGKSKAWFNQRVGLLRLTDEMVQLVLDGKLTAFREMRRYATMPPEEQYAAWKAEQEQLPRTETVRQEPEAAPQSYTAVYTSEPSRSAAYHPQPDARHNPALHSEPLAYTAVYAPAGSVPTPEAVPRADRQLAGGGENIPEPRTAAAPTMPASAPTLKRFPYDNGAEAAQHLLHKTNDTEFAAMMPPLLERWHQIQSKILELTPLFGPDSRLNAAGSGVCVLSPVR